MTPEQVEALARRRYEYLFDHPNDVPWGQIGAVARNRLIREAEDWSAVVDGMLAEARAAVWQEGFLAGAISLTEVGLGITPDRPNPYRKATS